MTTIAVFVGSLRKDSFNLKLARNIERLAPRGVEFKHADLNLPLFSEDLEAAGFPPKATALKQLVERSDGVLFVTPEYNRSFSSALKNAIDWASRPWGKNSFAGKPAAIAGASISVLGAAQAQSQLRNVLLYLDTKLLGQPEVYFNGSKGFDADGNVVPESEAFLRSFAQALVEHVKGER